MKILINLIKSNNPKYINFLYNKFSDVLVNVVINLIKDNFSYLSIDKEKLYKLSYEVCSSLSTINESIVKKFKINKILQLLMIYKTICIQDINDNHFDEVSKLIFNEYFILGNSIPIVQNIKFKSS